MPHQVVVLPAELEGATRDQLAAWLAERDRYYRECGCKTGLAGAATGLAMAWLWIFAAEGTVGTNGLLGITVTATVLVACGAAAGKMIGKAHARRRLRRATSRLIAEQRSSSVTDRGRHDLPS